MWPFPYVHSVSPGHLPRFGDVQISPLFSSPDCLPIRRRVQNGGRFGYLPNTFPSRIIIVCGIRVAETPARKSIDTHYEQPTSPLRPTATGRAEGAFFVSDFSRASKRTRGETQRNAKKVVYQPVFSTARSQPVYALHGFICVMLTLMITRLHPLLSRAPRRSHAPSGTRHNPVPLNR
jgi:hypothetical protein